MKVILPVVKEEVHYSESDPDSSCDYSVNSNSDSGGFCYSTGASHGELSRPRHVSFAFEMTCVGLH